ncbi:MAG: type II secretion system F family protein [Candidatus Roizmanbacteria bacterium]
MKFTYKALLNNEIKKGKVEAYSEKEVTEFLRNSGFFPIEIKQAGDFSSQIAPGLFNRLTESDIIHFTREMSIMLNAGMTISSSMDILMQQTNKPAMKDLLNEIDVKIRSGSSFSAVLNQYPRYFPRIYVSLIKAGEASGKLTDILLKLADDMEKQREFVSKVKGALTYPALIIVGVIGVVFVLITFVVPQLLGLYKDLNIELPLTTRLLVTASDFMSAWWPFILLGIGVAIFFARKYLNTEKGRYWRYATLMSLPILGNVMKMSSLVTITRTLSLLISSGVLVLESIGIVKDATDNIVYQHALDRVYYSIQKGLTISFSLEKESAFPPILVQMTAVGERTGKIDEILHKMSDYFESESNIAIKSMMTAVEPLILVVLGGIVLFIVMAVITPIYSLTGSIGSQ